MELPQTKTSNMLQYSIGKFMGLMWAIYLINNFANLCAAFFLNIHTSLLAQAASINMLIDLLHIDKLLEDRDVRSKVRWITRIFVLGVESIDFRSFVFGGRCWKVLGFTDCMRQPFEKGWVKDGFMFFVQSCPRLSNSAVAGCKSLSGVSSGH